MPKRSIYTIPKHHARSRHLSRVGDYITYTNRIRLSLASGECLRGWGSEHVHQLSSTLTVLISTLTVLISTLTALISTLTVLISTLNVLISTLTVLISTLTVLISLTFCAAPGVGTVWHACSKSRCRFAIGLRRLLRGTLRSPGQVRVPPALAFARSGVLACCAFVCA